MESLEPDKKVKKTVQGKVQPLIIQVIRRNGLGITPYQRSEKINMSSIIFPAEKYHKNHKKYKEFVRT